MAHLRFHTQHADHARPFGADAFGRRAEAFARFFGTPMFLLGQTAIVAVWIAVNAARIATYDPYPFILLNLAFSLQAAYAAPLILLAQTRQADRDKSTTDADARHREELSRMQIEMLEQNTDITRQVAELTRKIEGLTEQIHGRVVSPKDR